MKCSELMERLEILAPTSYAEEWDNVGLLVGSQEKEITRIYIAVDATDEVIEEALKLKADLLLTHHPLIFKGQKRVTDDHFIGRRILKLAKGDICYIAMHTNFDVMGMADAASDELRLKDRQVLSVTFEDEISKEGIGRYGRLPESMDLEECAKYVKEIFQLDSVRVFGNPRDIIEIAAVTPGSGKSVIEDAITIGADVLITGDIDHHEGIDAVARGMSIIDAGHYGLEKIFVPYMRDYLKRELPNLEIITAKRQDPFWII